MNRARLRRALSRAGLAFLLLIALLSIDAWIAMDRFDPLPSANVAAVAAGWATDTLRQWTVDATGGPFGSSAVVRYRRGDRNRDEVLEVRLRRPLLAPRWEVVNLVAR